MMFTCPVCQTENPQRANFCYHCGHPFQLACPRCNTRLPDAAKFCFHCGFQLSELGETELERSKKRTEVTGDQRSRPVVPLEDSVSTGLTRFIPPALASKLETARLKGEMAGERKIVTILFCDVKGSTHAAEGLDPEDWTEIINGAFEQMIAPVYQYEGIVARLMGDAILAFFGAPIAHEDDPQRAVLAGLEISSRMQQYHQQIQKRYGIDIDVRVGINTGLVVVGAVGSDLRMEYTAMGDATNLAARMEQTAEPGSVQISEATYKLVAPLFEVDEIGELQVRGKSAPVKAYRVLRRKTDPGRTRGVSRQEVRMVNREAELSSLQDILANLEHGVGRIVAVVGEAGLGKSRLIREIQSSSDRLSPDVRWFSTARLSYESGQPYGLFQRLLRRMLQIQAGEAPEVIREKIGSLHGIKQAGGLENLAIEELFGLELAKDQVWLEGEAFKRALYDALYALFQQEFTGRPGVIVFDDMHWADQASVQLLQHMFTLTEVVPLVLIFLLRPDRNVPGWALRSGAESDFHHRYTEIRLQPLSKEESHELIDRLLNIPDLSADFREAIVDRTGGNPFYIEEVVENLIESKRRN
jgi:class 3 adenylate cyclase/ribosomal protein L40E